MEQKNNRDYILLEDVTENNLKHVSLAIPKRKITVFTGVSGSGKSSLVFDTIGAEAQRQLSETYSAYVRNHMPRFARPRAGRIENLSPAIVVEQKKLGGSSRSTVGTITDIQPLLRLLFSRIGQPRAGSAGSFSFNDPEGACPVCNGLGKTTVLDEALLLDYEKSLNTGAILFPIFPVGSWYWKTYVLSGLFDNDKPLGEYTPGEVDILLHGKPGAKVELPSKSGPFVFDYEGLVEKITRLFIQRKQSNISENVLRKISGFLVSGECPACHGARLCQRVLDCRIRGKNIAGYAAMDIAELVEELGAIDDPVAATIVAQARERLGQMVDMGLGYLSLGRETATLSGGESQRIKMLRHLNSSLADMAYIFDEPSVGMHPRDVHFLNGMLTTLRDKGNTILVVEHNRDIIEAADYVFDIGPGAGEEGGRVVFSGTVAALRESDTRTGAALRRKAVLPQAVRAPKGHFITVSGRQNNLRDFTLHLPKGVFTVVAGVSGSGKSTLLREVFLPAHPEAVLIDQSPIGVSSRSTPATYVKIFDEIRKAFAKENGVEAALFSFNSKGACPECKGAGYVYTDLAFMEPIRTLCKTCGGKRYGEEVLSYRLPAGGAGKNISQVLEMTVRQALGFFAGQPKVERPLALLEEVGLSYLRIGQPLSTLSGGECQRLKLATELRKKGRVYVMDEPTTGLHMAETQRLLKIISRLVEGGGTVIVIEHDPDVIAAADWVVELGPGSGRQGGQVVFEGTPRQLAQRADTATGACLAALLGR